jgi:hypothetical protein
MCHADECRQQCASVGSAFWRERLEEVTGNAVCKSLDVVGRKPVEPRFERMLPRLEVGRLPVRINVDDGHRFPPVHVHNDVTRIGGLAKASPSTSRLLVGQTE